MNSRSFKSEKCLVPWDQYQNSYYWRPPQSLLRIEDARCYLGLGYSEGSPLLKCRTCNWPSAESPRRSLSHKCLPILRNVQELALLRVFNRGFLVKCPKWLLYTKWTQCLWHRCNRLCQSNSFWLSFVRPSLHNGVTFTKTCALLHSPIYVRSCVIKTLRQNDFFHRFWDNKLLSSDLSPTDGTSSDKLKRTCIKENRLIETHMTKGMRTTSCDWSVVQF